VFPRTGHERKSIWHLSGYDAWYVGIATGVAGSLGAFFSAAIAGSALGRVNNLDINAVMSIATGGLLIAVALRYIGKYIIIRWLPRVEKW
jgi:hypothetical protein